MDIENVSFQIILNDLYMKSYGFSWTSFSQKHKKNLVIFKGDQAPVSPAWLQS